MPVWPEILITSPEPFVWHSHTMYDGQEYMKIAVARQVALDSLIHEIKLLLERKKELEDYVPVEEIVTANV